MSDHRPNAWPADGVAVLAAMAANLRALLPSSPGDSAAVLEQRIRAVVAEQLGATPFPGAPATPRVNPPETSAPLLPEQLAGMDEDSGQLVRGRRYLYQRLRDALTTPRASQCLLRARGSDLYEQLDQPLNAPGVLRLMAAVAATLNDPLAGVPDFRLTRIQVQALEGAGRAYSRGQIGLSLWGESNSDPLQVVL